MKAQPGIEAQVPFATVDKTTLPREASLIIDYPIYDGSLCSASRAAERNCSTIPVKRCASIMNGEHEQTGSLATQPRAETLLNTESLRSRSSRSKTSQGRVGKRSPDSVPLYNQGARNAARTISELQRMENRFRAETTRRISQVKDSQVK
ncbi:hypothetical protein RRF57_003463 [Xylaria bambusicola]|uniref:Uncharacterized protein n=1 Tax=Xylaria bambusicola TaxID=326684 RepID=A0AAN7UF51_9PEZI